MQHHATLIKLNLHHCEREYNKQTFMQTKTYFLINEYKLQKERFVLNSDNRFKAKLKGKIVYCFYWSTLIKILWIDQMTYQKGIFKQCTAENVQYVPWAEVCRNLFLLWKDDKFHHNWTSFMPIRIVKSHKPHFIYDFAKA